MEANLRPSPLEYNIIVPSKRSIPFKIHTSGEWLWAKQKCDQKRQLEDLIYKIIQETAQKRVPLGSLPIHDHSIDGTDNLMENLLQSHFQHLLNTDYVLILEITGMGHSIVESSRSEWSENRSTHDRSFIIPEHH